MIFFTSIWQPLLRLLNQRDRKRGITIVALMVLNAILDFFSLASFLPLIFLVINPDFISSNHLIQQLYTQFQFTSPSSFTIAFTLLVLLFTVLKNAVALWITRVKSDYCFSVGSEISSRMLGHYSETSYLRFTQLDFSKEINRIASVPFAFANNIIMPLSTLISEGLVFLILMVCIGLYDVKIFTVLVVVLIPVAIVYFVNRKHLKQISNDLKLKYPLTLKYAIQMVEGLVDIKAFGKEPYFKNQFDQASRDLSKTLSRDHVYQTSGSRLTEIIAALIICVLILYSIFSFQNSQHTFLTLAIYAGTSFRMIPSLNRILNAMSQIKTYEYLFAELNELISTRTEKMPILKILQFNNAIEMRGISFQYPDRERILNGASLEIRKGEKIALVGKSGEGKTTLLMVLLQFLNVNEGKILLDGIEIRKENLLEWRRLFSYVPQSPYILDGTIVENIAFGYSAEKINISKIQQLIKDLELEDMILQFPEGLSTQVGERGVKLSGGQRQRLAIARALYADAEVILFDEVTNQLDVESEKEIIKTLERIASSQTKTILMITHHAHLLSHFDRVLALENGVLTER